MAMLLPLLFLLPIIEMYLLIRVGGHLGAWPTIALVVGTAFVGILLLRHQGPAVFNRVRARLQAGEMPAQELAEGALLALAGVFLLLPGFFTDTFGLLLLVPACRAWAAGRLAARVTVAGVRPGGRHVVIEGEFERRPPYEAGPAAPAVPRDRLEKSDDPS
jgi:UPF0716 protein FxsA